MKTRINQITYMIFMIFICGVLFGCNNSTGNEYTKLTLKEANVVIQNELKDITWTDDVSFSNPQFMCAEQLEDESMYRVVYYSKYTEDEEIEYTTISIYLDENKNITDSKISYASQLVAVESKLKHSSTHDNFGDWNVLEIVDSVKWE